MVIENLAFVHGTADKWRQAMADPLYDDFQRKNRTTKVHWSTLIQYGYTKRWMSNTCDQIRKYDGLARCPPLPGAAWTAESFMGDDLQAETIATARA
jgi:hypothetical protein